MKNKLTNFDKIKLGHILLQEYKATIDCLSNDYNDFFERNVKNIDAFFIDNFSIYENGITNLAHDYRLLLREIDEKNVYESFNFSIFEIVKFKRKEEHLHSPLLSQLLVLLYRNKIV